MPFCNPVRLLFLANFKITYIDRCNISYYYFCYQLYKLRAEQKRIEQDKTTKLAEWSKQELQRPIIQQLLKKTRRK